MECTRFNRNIQATEDTVDTSVCFSLPCVARSMGIFIWFCFHSYTITCTHIYTASVCLPLNMNMVFSSGLCRSRALIYTEHINMYNIIIIYWYIYIPYICITKYKIYVHTCVCYINRIIPTANIWWPEFTQTSNICHTFDLNWTNTFTMYPSPNTHKHEFNNLFCDFFLWVMDTENHIFNTLDTQRRRTEPVEMKFRIYRYTSTNWLLFLCYKMIADLYILRI